MNKTPCIYRQNNLNDLKKILFITIILSLSLALSGQNQTPFPSKEEIKQFMASKTCVVLEADPFYNAYIKEAVKDFWKITPYEFIEVKEFNLRRKDPAYSFIVLTETNFDRDKSGSVFNFINLLQGKKVDKLVELPEICAVPLSFLGADDYE